MADLNKIIDEKQQGSVVERKNLFRSSKKVYIESYGCQMNFSDSEVVAAILKKEGYSTTKNPNEANLILLNTCSIREKAEQTVRKRLEFYNAIKNVIYSQDWNGEHSL